MRAQEFAEDNLGTNPRRTARSGARHSRGHEPVPRYRSMDEADTDKIAGRYDPEEFDAMVQRVGQRAQQGELKTVWDAEKRVYRNVPVDADQKTDIAEQAGVCAECGGASFSDLILAEKQDACYHKVRSRYKVWPSAYASGALVQCRKKGAANWGTGGKKE